jgi:thiol-disulfide isomerase/thioredoxin
LTAKAVPLYNGDLPPKEEIFMSVVSVVCPCGEGFEREVKRGRPAIWCPPCREIPMAKRVSVPFTQAAEDGEPVEDRVVNPNDKYDGPVRDGIEANVAAVYAEWPAVWASRDNDEDANAWLSKALRDAYPAGH